MAFFFIIQPIDLDPWTHMPGAVIAVSSSLNVFFESTGSSAYEKNHNDVKARYI